jgi:hypothetical protein
VPSKCQQRAFPVKLTALPNFRLASPVGAQDINKPEDRVGAHLIGKPNNNISAFVACTATVLLRRNRQRRILGPFPNGPFGAAVKSNGTGYLGKHARCTSR